jgi:hypothetical protein
MTPEERASLAESQIIGDEGLTGDLEDAEATRLINWAVILARRLAMQAASMDPAQADTFYEATMPVLRRIVRKINVIGGGLPDGSAELIEPDVEVIFQSSMQLPSLMASPTIDVEGLSHLLAGMTPMDAVNKLTSMLTLEEQVND